MVTKRKTTAEINPKDSGLKIKTSFLHFLFCCLISKFVKVFTEFSFSAKVIFKYHRQMIRNFIRK